MLGRQPTASFNECSSLGYHAKIELLLMVLQYTSALRLAPRLLHFCCTLLRLPKGILFEVWMDFITILPPFGEVDGIYTYLGNLTKFFKLMYV